MFHKTMNRLSTTREIFACNEYTQCSFNMNARSGALCKKAVVCKSFSVVENAEDYENLDEHGMQQVPSSDMKWMSMIVFYTFVLKGFTNAFFYPSDILLKLI